MTDPTFDKMSSSAGWAPLVAIGFRPFSALFAAMMFSAPDSEPTPLALVSAHMFLWSFLWGFALLILYAWFCGTGRQKEMWVIWVVTGSYYVLAYAIFLVDRVVLS